MLYPALNLFYSEYASWSSIEPSYVETIFQKQFVKTEQTHKKIMLGVGAWL